MADQTTGSLPAAGAPASRRAVVSWCFYDFANSPFTTLVVTFIYASYFTQGHCRRHDLGDPGLVPGRHRNRSGRGSAVTNSGSGGRSGRLPQVLPAALDRRLASSSRPCSTCPSRARSSRPCSGSLWPTSLSNCPWSSTTPCSGNRSPESHRRISGYGWALGYAGRTRRHGLGFRGFRGCGHAWFGFSREPDRTFGPRTSWSPPGTPSSPCPCCSGFERSSLEPRCRPECCCLPSTIGGRPPRRAPLPGNHQAPPGPVAVQRRPVDHLRLRRHLRHRDLRLHLLGVDDLRGWP